MLGPCRARCQPSSRSRNRKRAAPLKPVSRIQKSTQLLRGGIGQRSRDPNATNNSVNRAVRPLRSYSARLPTYRLSPLYCPVTTYRGNPTSNTAGSSQDPTSSKGGGKGWARRNQKLIHTENTSNRASTAISSKRRCNGATVLNR